MFAAGIAAIISVSLAYAAREHFRAHTAYVEQSALNTTAKYQPGDLCAFNGTSPYNGAQYQQFSLHCSSLSVPTDPTTLLQLNYANETELFAFFAVIADCGGLGWREKPGAPLKSVKTLGSGLDKFKQSFADFVQNNFVNTTQFYTTSPQRWVSYLELPPQMDGVVRFDGATGNFFWVEINSSSCAEQLSSAALWVNGALCPGDVFVTAPLAVGSYACTSGVDTAFLTELNAQFDAASRLLKTTFIVANCDWSELNAVYIALLGVAFTFVLQWAVLVVALVPTYLI